MTRVLDIEVFFDLICPWCLIGKRNLEKARGMLAVLRPDVEARIHWKGVQLLPDLAPEGVPFKTFYLQRLGSEAAVLARQAQVQAAAAQAGADIDLQRIQVMPNTANAHRLLAHVGRQGSAGLVDSLLERLFAGYFQLGENIGDRELLLRLGKSCGLDPQLLAAVLVDDGRPYVGNDAPQGGGGVPAYLIDGRIYLVGAQPPELILAQLERALTERRGALVPSP
jgi:predicted DsbA family dithiol-disulfide isomerase